MKFEYIWDIVICEQNMATNGVKNIRSSSDPTVISISLFNLTILGVRGLALSVIR